MHPGRGVTERLANVTVVGVVPGLVTVEDENGDRRIVEINTLVNVDAERQRRHRRRRWGSLLELLGLAR